ncbi:MAG TPA: MBL fold metallo-hydrolase [Spongiibacteraceae bacterium]|nr:MBL fold metallo-hydrolase [Spongiibacteraceae bacterium]
MNQAVIQAFFHEPTFTVSYVVADPATRCCAVIDPVLDYDANIARTGSAFADRIIAFVRERDYTVQWLLETHAHADHLSAAFYLRAQLGGAIAIGEHIVQVQKVFGKLFNAGTEFARDGSQFDRLLRDGEVFTIGALPVRVLHTPGHTLACITYLIEDCAFIGDTLFMPDYGSARCDFPGGDARVLYRSIRRILELPAHTQLFLCHDYLPPGRSDYRWQTTVAEQNNSNVHAHVGIDEAAFVALRTARDRELAKPKLLLPSVQVNMRAGQFPPAESNGVSYLKIPLNAL